tara:strand:- start:365 stop:709 length:345 start_codon:yes stop_codon:yes gene_type:complete
MSPGKIINEIENMYPETCTEFKSIQKEQYETFCKKQYDYGQHNITLGMDLSDPDNRHLSITAIIIRINDKIQRLFNLVLKRKAKAQNEPVEDAFKDLSVYGIIAQIVTNGKWGK